jgi:hypothetical protein
MNDTEKSGERHLARGNVSGNSDQGIFLSEHKARQRLTAKLIQEHRFCCLCGGKVPATTADHIPAKIIFPHRHRPKGLEFPTCSRCNHQGRYAEALLAFAARTTGSARPNAVRDDSRLRDIMSTIEAAHPGLLEQMNRGPTLVRRNGIIVPAGILNFNLAPVNEAFCMLAAKIALAMYYHVNGKQSSEHSIINTTWGHSFDREARSAVDQILLLFPQSIKLTQGSWKTDSTFFARHGVNDGNFFVACVFHESIFLAAEILRGPPSPSDTVWMAYMTNSADSGIIPWSAAA